MKTFNTYEEAKSYGGNKCVVLTTADEWDGKNLLLELLSQQRK